jgi:hypothetical protein
MSYYIRVLADVPGAFEFLRRRAWRASNRVANPPAEADLVAMFPDLPSRFLVFECKTTTQESPPSPAPLGRIGQRRPNPALGLTRVTFTHK